MAKHKNKLTQVHTHEVSLVRRGANGKRFALTKGLNMNELIEAVLKTEAEGEAAMIATLGSDATEEQVDIAKANFRLQVGFQDKLTKAQFSQVSKASFGEETPGKEPPKPAPVVVVPASVQKSIDAKDAEIAQLKKSADEATEEITKTAKVTLRKSLFDLVEKEFKHVAGQSSDEMADLLMDLHDVSKELMDRVTKTWAGTKASALLESNGTVKKNDGKTNSSWEQIVKSADEMVTKRADPKFTQAMAIAQVAKDQPELYRAYKEEKGA